MTTLDWLFQMIAMPRWWYVLVLMIFISLALLLVAAVYTANRVERRSIERREQRPTATGRQRGRRR